ncbi:DUF4232 domain-containing protein [Lentzea sp. NPDC006480]|uniref:DUF4232 domain-containing protein n=1 Tax=Lentzea sp. NPDC006480 TaxID=3157176 RepID=UPI0033BC4F2A
MVAALAGLVGCGARPEAAPVPQPVALSTPTTGEPSCDTGLQFRMTTGDSAMGLRIRGIEVLNCGTEPLELNGYPQVKLFDEDRQQLDVQVLDGSGGISRVDGFDDPPQPIVVQPGESAKSAFMWKNTNTSIDPPQLARHADFAAAPGGTFQPLLTSDGRDLYIDLGSTGRIGVRAWYR